MVNKEKIKEQQRISKEKKQRRINIFLIGYFRWFIVFVILLFFGVSYFFFLKVKHKDVKKVFYYVGEEKREEYAEKKKYLKNLRELISVYNSISEEDKNKVATILPTESYQDNFFTNIENLISDMGFKLNYLRIETEEEKEKSKAKKIITSEEKENILLSKNQNIGAMNLSFGISGINYSNMKKIISSIENNLRIMDVTNLNYSPDSGELDLEIKTYYLKDI